MITTNQPFVVYHPGEKKSNKRAVLAAFLLYKNGGKYPAYDLISLLSYRHRRQRHAVHEDGVRCREDPGDRKILYILAASQREDTSSQEK